ncbi:MAG: T9SS type A sorting domain-containing protein [Prolixibacteraceae bacterium]|nr:T9SS type A sorting domain-containing protein [Prolixibacteraceae bacterium]
MSMKLKEISITLFILTVFLPFLADGQISQYGVPIQVIKQKSVSQNSDLVVMPTVDNLKMRSKYSRQNTDLLKSFRFAHSFDVSLTPKNSGKWYNTTEVNVWQLRIRSTDAYSLNLILDQFHLPENARLYLISAKTGDVKGAFTSANNSENNILAIEPVEGDELMVQYEEPVNVSFPGQIRISKVAHDFVGILTYDPRIPLGLSGACNINVNCDLANGTENIRDAVCRIIIEGAEICSGALINNTAMDGTPYVLTAYHCISTAKKAQSSVFLFNFESPYCGSIIGDVSRSLSGSSLKASLNVLDFSLVQLNTTPPYYYRPYLVGWNRKTTPPTSTICIHQPYGDIKKIAIDNNPSTTASYSGTYLTNGFWRIGQWEKGVTEVGSSGGPLFDPNKLLVGTLTGGGANCTLPTNDYFEKFALSWNHRTDSISRQLKYWLDPLNSGAETLSGMSLYSGKLLCKPATNFKDNDTHAAIQISTGLTKKGYWSGSNLIGYTDFAEKFTFAKNCEIQGVTLGIAKIKTNAAFPTSYIDVQVYGGINEPTTLLYTEKFDTRKFMADGMNYLPFKTPVKTVGTFFISYNITQMHSGDTLAVYMANRSADVTNSFYLKNQSGWTKYNSTNTAGNGSALLMELIACNVDDTNGINDFGTELTSARFYPNPLSGNSLLNVQTTNEIDCPEEIVVFDLVGKQIQVPVIQTGSNSLTLNFAGKRPGIYMVHMESGGHTVVGKIAYIP